MMITVLFAVQNLEEQESLRQVISEQKLEMEIVLAETLNEVDALVNSGTVDIIITDLRFQNGGLADWLFLWQHPFVLIADWTDYERITEIVKDQTSDFVIRDEARQHIRFLPMVIRKVLNNKESMDRHNYDLRMNEQRYMELVQALPDIVYSLDEAGRFLYINESVQTLGWSPVELIGQHFSTILDSEYVEKVSRKVVLQDYSGKVTGPEQAPKLFDERRTGPRRTHDLEVRLRHKNSVQLVAAELYGSVTAYGEVNATGFQDSGTVGIIRDVTERYEANRLLRESLGEKDMLLAEIHHRVKNNLQIISSLLNLQATGIEDSVAQGRFVDAQMQIQSMALIHEHLYQSASFGEVDLSSYVGSLIEYLSSIYSVDPVRVRVVLQADPFPITMNQAVPVALLLNELISNSLKYAFPNGASGSVTVELRLGQEQQVSVCVRDDGVGLPEDFDITSGTSLGQTLIQGLAQQLGGNVQIESSGGTCYSVRFLLEEPAR